MSAYGVFQSFYKAEMLSESSSSNISWIGSTHACLLCLMGFLTGPLFDGGYGYVLLYVGSSLVVIGMFMTSLCTQFWQVMLAQGICIGLGSGCLFVPSVGIVTTYFSTRKSLAMGLASSGSSVAGVIYPIMFTHLQPRIGFAWTTRVIGFIMLGSFSFAIAVYRVRVLPAERRRLLDLQALREPPYALFSVMVFITNVGLYVPYFYVQSYANEQHISPADLPVYMVPLVSGGSALGRIVPNLFTERTGPLNMLILCNGSSAILAFCWLAVYDAPGLVVFSLMYGFWSGTIVSLLPLTVASLCPSLGVFGTRMGINAVVTGLGTLVGNPLAGVIMDAGSWTGTTLFCACTLAVGTAFVVFARLAKSTVLLASV